MLKKKDIMKSSTQDALAQEQASDLGTATSTLSEQSPRDESDEWNNIAQASRRLIEKYPLLRSTDDSDKLQHDLRELQGHQNRFNQDLEYVPLTAAMCLWLSDIEEETTREKYAESMTDMLDKKIIHEHFADGKVFTVGGFRHINHQGVIDYIKNIPEMSEGARQLRAASYISFTAYLHKISDGWFRKANADANKTFYRLSPKTMKQALSLESWHRFLESIYEDNLRDSLIARALLFGGHRASEILNLKYNQIDFDKNIIRFARGREKGLELPIVYPESFMKELRTYLQTISDRKKESGYVFVTRNAKPLTRSRLNYAFSHASEQAGIAKVTPEILRATWTMLNQQNLVDDKILNTKRYNFHQEEQHTIKSKK